MPRLRKEEGSTLILLIGIVAVLAILAATLVMVSANVQGGTTTDKERVTTFDVAEAGLDATTYLLGLQNMWPTATAPYALSQKDLDDFRTEFPVADYPAAPGGKPLLTVRVCDDPSVTNSPAYDANGDNKLWVEAQANVGDKAARIRVQLLHETLSAPLLGAVVYSGDDAEKKGSGDITSTMLNGQPTGAVYVNGEFKGVGSGELDQVTLKVRDDASTNPPYPFPPLSQFMPDTYVQSLILASKTASAEALPANTHSGWKPDQGTYTAAIRVNGDLKLGAGDYTFGSVYVTGNVDKTGTGECSFAALYVGGNLDISAKTTRTWGPTYVGGNLDLTGSGTLNVSLIVVGGEIDVAGSGQISGDGVGTNAKPATIISVGQDKSVKWTGSGDFYGLLVAMYGEFDHAGSGNVHGAELAGKSWKQSGAGDIMFNSDVSVNMGNVFITTMVNNTWQEISPL